MKKAWYDVGVLQTMPEGVSIKDRFISYKDVAYRHKTSILSVAAVAVIAAVGYKWWTGK